jgi:protein TonB
MTLAGAATDRLSGWRPAAPRKAGARRSLAGTAIACSALVHAAAFVAFGPFADRSARSIQAPVGPTVVHVALAPWHASGPEARVAPPDPPVTPRRPALPNAGASGSNRPAIDRASTIDGSPGSPAPETTPSVGLPIPADPPVVTASAAPGTSPSPVVPPGSSAAAYLRTPEPVYPAASREEGEEGLVVLRVRISRTGLPEEILVERSSGHRLLDRAAVDGVRRWTFAPARLGDEAIEAWMEVPIRFRLG